MARVGRGAFTPLKHEHFEGLVAWQVAMASGPCARFGWDYWYVEMNAGPGRIDQDPTYRGSPLRALPIVFGRIPRARALLCEIDQHHAARLRREIAILEQDGAIPTGRVLVNHGDHRDTLRLWAVDRARNTMGLCFHDPNGMPSFDALRFVGHVPALERLDILAYLSATAIKRASHERPLEDQLRAVGKTVSVVREPQGAHQWTFFLLSNYERLKEWRRERFFRTDGADGRRIVDTLTLDQRQLHARLQPMLPLFGGTEDRQHDWRIRGQLERHYLLYTCPVCDDTEDQPFWHCPRCAAHGWAGDSCEVCGTAYDPEYESTPPPGLDEWEAADHA